MRNEHYDMADALYKAGYEDARRERNYDPRGNDEWQSLIDLLSKLRAPVADERALDLLDTLFTAYENGTPCYEEPDSQGGYLGMAFRVDDNTFRACADLLNKHRPRADAALASAPVAGEAQEHIEQMAVNRYRPVPDGKFNYKVVAGDGTRSLYTGTKDSCLRVAAKLTEAFLDGAFVASDAAPQASNNK